MVKPSRREFVITALALPLAASAKAASQTAVALPQVVMLATGGTIAAVGSSPTDLSNYRSGVLPGDQILAAVPQVKQVADIRVEQVFNVPSYDLAVSDWLRLAKRINDIFEREPKVAGIVVTHGTSTLEETAYFLHLTVRHDRPVVLVGSMRPATAISADGPLNLLNAVRTAASPDARGKGVLVVMNEEINGARDVTKTNTFRVETFRAPELGLLGYVDEDRVAFYRASTKRHTSASEFDVSNLETLPKVDVVYSYLEADTAPLDTLVQRGAKGIILAGTGPGSLSDQYKTALKRLSRDRTPAFVIASRVGNGRVIPRAEYDELNLIPADNLNPQKARILLMLALTKTADPRELRRMFTEY